MVGIVILAAALASGQCPTCGNGPGLGIGPSNMMFIKPAPSFATHCHVGCNGQNCFSATRPLYPGAVPFDYRTDFNYPWSQAPCGLVPSVPPGMGRNMIEASDWPEDVPAYEARRKTKSAAPRPLTTVAKKSSPTPAKLRW